MNPWTLIGWAIVGAVGTWTLYILTKYIGRPLAAMLVVLRRHVRDRGVSPEAGQCWVQDGRSRIFVKRIADNGRIVLTTGAASWSDSPDEWRARVRQRRLYLEDRNA